jgi:hypothetical protein
MVLYAIAYGKPIWFCWLCYGTRQMRWLYMLDSQLACLRWKGSLAFALISPWIVL